MSTNLLNVVVAESTAILKLLAGKDQALLIRGNAFLILNLALHIVDSIARLHLEGDGLTREGLDENLHCTVVSSTIQIAFRWRILFAVISRMLMYWYRRCECRRFAEFLSAGQSDCGLRQTSSCLPQAT